MDVFPAGVGQSCWFPLSVCPSIAPSSAALDLAPGTLLQGLSGILPPYPHPDGEDSLGNGGSGAGGRTLEQYGYGDRDLSSVTAHSRAGWR